ncbi:Hypp6417 [Branchiostoma lanceolatum]|uniref:Hypp6417 protein n=1 Tax=Branchiostoma lanceolatum TaxID=7740 RepID=A0A8K0E4E2_BRALA|nr:Hypp6417 [Branchiostoma lanceolatum]
MEVASTTNSDLQLVSDWFNVWGLELHPDKCKVICIKSTQSRIELPPIYISGQLIEQVPFYSHLGVTLHQALGWNEHAQTTSSKARKVLGYLWRLRGKLSQEALELAYLTLVRLKLEYASILFSNMSAAASKVLERVQYHAGRLVTGAAPRTPYSDVLQELGWDRLSTRRDYNRLVIMYKLVTGSVPPHLQPLIPSTRQAQTQLRLRNSVHLHIPRCRTNIYKNSFIPYTSRLWNNLPRVVTESPTLSIFKARCKSHLLS